MAHPLLCTCKKCNPSLFDAIFGKSGSSRGDFKTRRPDGTTVYGPRGGDRTGQKHGHRGDNFNRTPHNTLGSAAIGRPHTEKGHKTERW